jgi:hypothetical protein
MVKTLTNLQWINLVLEKHQPYAYEGGTQRDPETRIICACQAATYPKNSFPRYLDHILSLIATELPGIFQYNERQDEGR